MEAAYPYRLLTLRFHDRQAEAAFAAERALRLVRPFRWVVAILAALSLLVGVAITVIAPESTALLNRTLLPSLVLSAASLAVTWHPVFIARQQAVVGSVITLAVLATLNMAVQYPTERFLASGFFLPAVQTFCIYALVGLRFPLAVALGWAMLAGYAAIAHVVHGLAGPALARQVLALVLVNLVGMLAGWQLEAATRRAFLGRRAVEHERARSEALLLNILPAPIAERLKNSPGTIAEAHPSVTVLFADIAGFTTWCATRNAASVVQMLDRVFTAFDALAARHGLEKIKTIGDCYMAAAGLPKAREDHAQAALAMAREMLAECERIARETGEPLQMRIGLSSGPVVAGVIGRSKFIFDLWGDTVNTASRMESCGEPGRIQCSASTARLLDGVALESRGRVEVRGKGSMEVFLIGTRTAEAALALD
ncbi:adenylate/guanylate cyclase domain-containing protein [Ramlibacter sp. PS4R-6]|uniref:adenylate/guanylate cyclase domain-containing protein n=1 Tax=Ramlibacter sp. PS4R-6 TaxID=3133438 RepID=UPI003095DF34